MTITLLVRIAAVFPLFLAWLAPGVANAQPSASPQNAVSPASQTVVVLPFTNVSGWPSDAWIGRGIAETVVADLQKAGVIAVVGPEALADEARRRGGSLPEDDGGQIALGRRLGAKWLLSGSYQHIGEQVRITGRLMDVQTGQVTGTVKLDGTTGQIFQLQDRIVGELGSVLTGTRMPAAAGPVQQPQPTPGVPPTNVQVGRSAPSPAGKSPPTVPPPAASQTLAVQGELSTWFTLNDEHPSTPGVGLRYLPTLSLEQTLPDGRSIDGEVSINAYGFGQSPGWHDFDTTGRLKPYRVWARFKTSRFEARIGLQKINFGSATLLRPLRWFDSVDPRDPLQITDGVYGLLVREYLPGNFTVWAWSLYGNDKLKGLELSPTRTHRPEFGGRFQTPLFKGEMAFTTHHRRADLSKGLTSSVAVGDPLARESRYALDGKWDVGIGLWFEGALVHQIRSALPSADERALTVGADYTFGLGNGLHVLGEYFVLESVREIPGQLFTTSFSAASVSYLVGLLDSVSGILYFDSARQETYRFVSWQRTYDRWRFYVMGFWNPRRPAIDSTGSLPGAGPNPLAGRGFQVMAVYNHGAGKDRPARTQR